MAGYGFDLRRFLAFCTKAGIEYPDAVTFRVVETYLGWLIPECGLKTTSANRHRYALWSLFRWLRREGGVAGTPGEDADPLNEPTRLPT